ncbi:MAG: cysteine desulfurase-like protein [Saprospiraceae bacterium]|nr:MAG: cysteine desulfurase-like protein [Saprospiraceae bacterium]
MNQQFRNRFPALRRIEQGKPLVFLDGPAGVQVPEEVIDAISQYYRQCNANTHGSFLTTKETDVMMADTRSKAAAFLGAPSASCISFGQNMTSLCYSLSRAIGRSLQPGDEVLITQLDHEANRGPWLCLREKGIIVREVRLKPNGTLDYDDMEAKINERTRVLAMGYASNLTGTVNDLQLARQLSYRYGTWLVVDAVHYAPHFSIDVQAIGCDFLLCSAYKFYGPHVGILYSRPGLLDRIQPDRLRTTDQHAPYSIETGTLNHAAIAGVNAAIDFIASLGKGDLLRAKLVSAMHQIREHERGLAKKMYRELSTINGITIIGPDMEVNQRAPTISFTISQKTPLEVCQALAVDNIFAWDGHFYALRGIEILGLLEAGGVTRVGISAYTAEAEIDQFFKSIQKISRT